MRDSLIGLRFVNGEGEILNAGGRVMKNVTGLDLVKIQCGAHGTLGLILEATFKLLPKPETEATIVLRRLDDAKALAAMSRGARLALCRQRRGDDPSPAWAAIFRAPCCASKASPTRSPIGSGSCRRCSPNSTRAMCWSSRDSQRLWRSIRDLEFLAEPRERAVWRVSVKPSLGAKLLEALGPVALASQLDWGGGLLGIASDPTEAAAAAIRAATRAQRRPRHAVARRRTHLRYASTCSSRRRLCCSRRPSGSRRASIPTACSIAGRMYADV